MMLSPRCRWMLACLLGLGAGPAVAAEPVVIRPQPAAGPLANPLKGWCPYGDAGPIALPYSMVYHYASWRELEPTEGQYDLDGGERRVWSKPASLGKHVIFRVYVDCSGRPSGLPDWLKGQVKLTRYTEHGGGLSPDYHNPALVERMERRIAALGKRDDADPRVAFLGLGWLDYWGSGTTGRTTGSSCRSRPRSGSSTPTTRRSRPSALMARSARDDAATRPWLGFPDDMFPEDTANGEDWSFLAGIRRAGRTDNWRRAPFGSVMVLGAAARRGGRSRAVAGRPPDLRVGADLGQRAPPSRVPPGGIRSLWGSSTRRRSGPRSSSPMGRRTGAAGSCSGRSRSWRVLGETRRGVSVHSGRRSRRC